MIYELNHFGIVVRDLESSLAFYVDALGARVVFEGYIEPTKTTIRYLQLAGGMIELLHRGEPREDEVFGIQHLGFMSDDLDADFARIVAAGYEPLVAPKAAGTGVGRLGFVSDPNGARIELLERDVDFRLAADTDGLVRSFDHYGINANDLGAAEAFYGDTLGMHPLRRLPVGTAGMVVAFYDFGYDVVSLIGRPDPVEGNPLAHLGLRVDDVDVAVAALAAHGITPAAGTPKAAGTGYGRILVVHDPDGVKLEIIDRVDLRELPA